MKIKKGKTIEIQEEVRISLEDKDVILEKGDRIEVVQEKKLEESVMVVGEQTISDVVKMLSLAKNTLREVSKVVSGLSSEGIFRYLVRLNFQSYYGKYKEGKTEEELEAEIDSFTMRRPTDRFAQAVTSVRAYLYQLEGEAERDPMADALRRINQTSSSYAEGFSDGKNLYWGS